MPIRPSASAAKMFFDSNVYEPAYLRYIAEQLAPGRIMLGSDYPYAIMQPDPIEFVAKAGFAGHAQEALLWRAAYDFLGVAG